MIEGQVKVYQCVAKLEFSNLDNPFIPPTVNDEKIYQMVREVSSEIVGHKNMQIAQYLMGSEDFAFYLEHVPGTLLLIGTRNEKMGSIDSPHSPYFTIDEDVLPIGAAIHAAFAHSYLLNSSQTKVL